MYVVDCEGTLIFYNTEGDKLYTEKNLDSNGTTFQSIVHHDSISQFKQFLKTCSTQGKQPS